MDLGDLRANRQATAERLFDVGGGGQMIGVHVGFQQPVQRQALLAHIGDQPVGASVGRAPGGRVVIKHRIDYGAAFALRVTDHIAVGEGGRIEKSLNLRVHT